MHHHTIAWRRHCRSSSLTQVILILAFWLAGELIVRRTGLPIPGAIAGLFIVLALLMSKRLSLRSVRRGAQLFLAEMLLFFVPAVLALLDHPEFLGLLGLKIFTVILLSTIIVMIVTGGVIDLCYRWSIARKGHVHAGA